MTSRDGLDPGMASFMRAKMTQIAGAARRDTDLVARWAAIDAARPARDAEARSILAAFWETGDLQEFRAASDSWSKTEGPYETFGGFGQMWINQVAKHGAGDQALVTALMDGLKTPVDLADAVAKFEAVERVTRDLASKGQPAVARIPLVLSIYWSTDPDDRRWPCMWPSAPEGMYNLGWLATWTNADRYRAFATAAQQLFPDDVHEFDRLLWFFVKREPYVGLNPATAEMCAQAADTMSAYQRSAGYADEDSEQRAETLARQLKGELQTVMVGLLDRVRHTSGLELEKSNLQLKTAFDTEAPYRADAYATWSLPGGMSSPGLRLWTTRSGVALGLYGGWNGSEEENASRVQSITPLLPDGVTYFQLRPHLTGDRLAPVDEYPGGEVFVGRWWAWDHLPDHLSVPESVLDVVAELSPALRALAHPPAQPADHNVLGGTGDLDLAALVTTFRAQRPYPNDKDSWHKDERRAFAEALTAENLLTFDLDAFRRLINGPRYGGPGPQSILNSSLSSMDSIAQDGFAANLRAFLWGDGSDAARIDRALDWNDLGVKGLGESVLLKMLAITQPERFLPVFPLGGPKGKLAMLKRLGLPMPDSTLTRGEQHIVANDSLRAVTERHLPGDAWGQGQLLYWLLDYEADEASEEDRFPGLAEALRMPEAFLSEIRHLLLSKGQVIFYGPPGTGKTFVAQKIAEALQPDKERVRVVQFHPSMSYEDFFEGFRPKLDEGQLVYELRPGPLAIMADRAEKAPGQPHVLIIDEINRANLPRVMGELLYLLEYRNKAVYTAYRPDEPFELPKNLYLIGTMNTADRSIAMMDAALRRRFHFIPFMPEEEALSDVLRSWLKAHGEDLRIADMVDRVNALLVKVLNGPHLQVGHSHFMIKEAGKGTAALTADRVERIWRYDIYPFIEDQLYGRREHLEQFAWDKVSPFAGKPAEGATKSEDAGVYVGPDDDVER